MSGSNLLDTTAVYAVSVWRLPDRDAPCFATDGPATISVIDGPWASSPVPREAPIHMDFYARRQKVASLTAVNTVTAAVTEGQDIHIALNLPLDDHGGPVDTRFGGLDEYNQLEFGPSPLQFEYRNPHDSITPPATATVQVYTGVTFATIVVLPPMLGLPMPSPGIWKTANSAEIQVFDTGILETRFMSPAVTPLADRIAEGTTLSHAFVHDLTKDQRPDGGFDSFGRFHTGYVLVNFDNAIDRDAQVVLTSGRNPMPMNISALSLNLVT